MIDKRLQGLAETVEIVASMQRDNERRIEKVTNALEALVRIAEAH
jgi:hypothetical protein